MTDLNQYIQAATRENTRRSYRSAIEHFEVEWGGFLPATAESISRYLSDYASSLAISTLRNRLAGLAQWHIDQGFPDPTKAPIVKKVLKGIQAVHPAKPKQAKPLSIQHLKIIDAHLEQQIHEAKQLDNVALLRKSLRNRAILLLGFWRGFRSDELASITVENVTIERDKGISIYLAKTKTIYQGITHKTPALNTLCPVSACYEWINELHMTNGPLFPRINRWGGLGGGPMHPASFISLIRNMALQAGVDSPELFSSHSLRRGFATWATESGWDIKSIMEYVGWKDIKSAIRYIDASSPFEISKLNSDVAKSNVPIFQ